MFTIKFHPWLQVYTLHCSVISGTVLGGDPITVKENLVALSRFEFGAKKKKPFRGKRGVVEGQGTTAAETVWCREDCNFILFVVEAKNNCALNKELYRVGKRLQIFHWEVEVRLI